MNGTGPLPSVPDDPVNLPRTTLPSVLDGPTSPTLPLTPCTGRPYFPYPAPDPLPRTTLFPLPCSLPRTAPTPYTEGLGVSLAPTTHTALVGRRLEFSRGVTTETGRGVNTPDTLTPRGPSLEWTQ